MDMVTTGVVEMSSDGEWTMDEVAKEDYRSDEDRCRDDLRAMRVALKKGHTIALQAFTPRKELHLVRAYIYRRHQPVG